ncbi:MAG TPA: Rnase Y domain-containing protein, partial [bacterium]
MLSLTAYIFIVAAFVIGAIFGHAVVRYFDKMKGESALQERERLLKDARTEADAIAKDIQLKAKDAVESLRNEAERDINRRKKEAERFEVKLQKKEETLDNKFDNLQKRIENVDKKEKRIVTLESDLELKISMQDTELERIAQLTQEQAKNFLLERMDKKLDLEYARRLADHEQHIKEDSDKLSKKIVTLAIQRTAVDHVAETTTSEVKLPSDDMKGRIIGREGRNIRTFETLTGVEVIIDDTPEAVVLSAFDPVRRAIATLTLEKLVQDGRIHPARIEETFEKSIKEIDK